MARKSQHIFLENNGYILGERLGRGAYGDVWKTYSTEHRSLVAVKEVLKHKAPPDFLEKFLPRELEIIKILRHPNIINFILAIETNKSVYIIMELAVGGTLLDEVLKNKYLDEEKACVWFHQLAEGMEYIHTEGYCHRDLKCENLLLTKHQILKIIDFGFAKGGLTTDIEMDNPTQQLSTTFCGSYAYSSTEVLQRIPYDPRMADMWSIGVVLYVMLYGKFPFNSSSLSTLVKQTQGQIEFPEIPQTTRESKKLIYQILKPEKDRLYFPELKKNKWFITYHSKSISIFSSTSRKDEISK